MGSTVTVRNIDPADKSWLRREARQMDVSMEELVRQLIREKRKGADQRPKPSEAFRRHFGPDHGVELPPLERYAYRRVEFGSDDET